MSVQGHEAGKWKDQAPSDPAAPTHTDALSSRSLSSPGMGETSVGLSAQALERVFISLQQRDLCFSFPSAFEHHV